MRRLLLYAGVLLQLGGIGVTGSGLLLGITQSSMASSMRGFFWGLALFIPGYLLVRVSGHRRAS